MSCYFFWFFPIILLLSITFCMVLNVPERHPLIIIIVIIITVTIIIVIISNGNRTEWSTIQGVMGRVI